MRPPHRWIILYDITEVKRLARIAKILVAKANRVQKSVFETFGGTVLVEEVRRNISTVMEEDDTVAYIPLCVEDWEKTIRLGLAAKDHTDPAVDDPLFL